MQASGLQMEGDAAAMHAREPFRLCFTAGELARLHRGYWYWHVSTLCIATAR